MATITSNGIIMMPGIENTIDPNAIGVFDPTNPLSVPSVWPGGVMLPHGKLTIVPKNGGSGTVVSVPPGTMMSSASPILVSMNRVELNRSNYIQYLVEKYSLERCRCPRR